MDEAEFEAVGRVEAGSADQDRLAITTLPTSRAIIVADGAGGTSGGRAAADALVVRFQSLFTAHELLGPTELVAELSKADADLERVGQTTAVVVVFMKSRVFGASVGDSGAWWVTAGGFTDLTEHQHRKPLIGSGAAEPVAFDCATGEGTLLVATDGLLKYAPPSRICSAVQREVLSEAVNDLIAGVRLRSGSLPDDVAVVLSRFIAHQA